MNIVCIFMARRLCTHGSVAFFFPLIHPIQSIPSNSIFWLCFVCTSPNSFPLLSLDFFHSPSTLSFSHGRLPPIPPSLTFSPLSSNSSNKQTIAAAVTLITLTWHQSNHSKDSDQMLSAAVRGKSYSQCFNVGSRGGTKRFDSRFCCCVVAHTVFI